jgi:CheY-like chemotaxis protein
MKNNDTEPNKEVKSSVLKQLYEHETQVRAKSELIDSMIYQIRTLSNAVIGFSDLLLTEPLSPDLNEYVQEIHGAGEGLSVLVGDVLQWTQLLSGKLEVSNNQCIISTILGEIKERLTSAAVEKDLDSEVTADPKMPEYVICDEGHLLKCLISLITNAIQYTEKGKIGVHAGLEISNDEPFVRFDVTDTGVGISPEKIKHLFDPTNSLLRSYKGGPFTVTKGLTVTTRLPLMKVLCDLLGGTLEVQSQVGVGSTFTLRIPVGKDINSIPKLGTSDLTCQSAHDDPEQPESKFPSRILLVEDQQSNRTVITLMLEALGVEVETAENGQEALEKINPDIHELILMDLKMPEMDGFEATRRLHEKGCAVPVVALSAKVLNEAEHNQIVDLFDGYLTKPVDSQKLSEALSKYSQNNSPRVQQPHDVSAGKATEETSITYEQVNEKSER